MLSAATKAPTKLASRSIIRNRLIFLFCLVSAIVLALGFSLMQVSKGARFHELNTLHLRHVLALNQQIYRNDSNPKNIEAIDIPSVIKQIHAIRAQPIECLAQTNRFDRLMMMLLNTDGALILCEQDIRQADYILAVIAQYQQGETSVKQLSLAIETAAQQFSANSENFLPPIAKTIEFTIDTATALAIGLGALLLGGVVFVARGILQVTNQMETTTEALTKSESLNRQLAHYDSLTGLPNRNLFRTQLARCIDTVNAEGGCLALFFIDLDRFKYINDSLGHLAGDELLVQAAQRLRVLVKKADQVCRLGGDEFTILLTDRYLPEAGAASLAEKILSEMARPFPLAHADAYVTASIGITLYPDDTQNADSLIKNADLAMYQAKSKGKNKFEFFSREMDQKILRRLEVESDLRKALERHELLLHYQPVVRLNDMSTVGAEALVRWVKADGQMISPADFIPVAEETGMILPIGEWVLDTACAQCRAWREQGNPEFRMSVNVSVLQLKAGGFAKVVQRILDKHQLPSNALDLEVTESLMVEDDEVVLQSLRELGTMGVRLLLDDFGIGYSSFSYLESLPFDILKVDRSFIQSVASARGKQKVAASIIAMAHQLSMKVVAEGVETLEALRHLRLQQCEYAQGYFLSRPVANDVFDCLADFSGKLTGEQQNVG